MVNKIHTSYYGCGNVSYIIKDFAPQGEDSGQYYHKRQYDVLFAYKSANPKHGKEDIIRILIVVLCNI